MRRISLCDEAPVVPPPATLVVESPRAILYLADGTPLQRKAGFDVRHLQTTGTFPELTKRTGKKKGKR